MRAQKKRCPKAVPSHLQNYVAWLRTLKCSVKIYIWSGPRPNLNSRNLYSCRSSCMIKWNKSTAVIIRRVMISWFCIRCTFKRRFLNIVQVPMETRPIRCHVGIHVDSTSISHSRWYVKFSVTGTWTSSVFSTNESAWSGMLTGSQSHVWRNGPKKELIVGQGQWSGTFLGIITGWDPSVCKSNRLHVYILQFFLY